MNEDNTFINMIGPDGKVRNIRSYMKDELLKKGFRVVINPKQEWYPQFDSSLKSNINPNITEVSEDSDFIRVEKL